MTPEDKSFVEECKSTTSSHPNMVYAHSLTKVNRLISIIEKLDLALTKCKEQRDELAMQDDDWAWSRWIDDKNKILDAILTTD